MTVAAADAPAPSAPPASKADAVALAAKVAADMDAAMVLAETNVDAAVDALLASEKTARLAEDTASTKLAAVGVVRVLARARQWAALGDAVATLAKRRGQAKQVIQAVVREAAALVLPSAAAGQHVAMEDDAAAAPPPSPPRPDKGADRDALIAALLTVTEGKIYVEIDRARLTRTLAAAKEATGDVDGAAALLQEVAVETFGAMAKTEKIDYILEQVRLCLDKGDFVRAHILSKKIAPRAFADAGKKGTAAGEVGIEGTIIEAAAPGTPALHALKLKYYDLLVRYWRHKGDALEVTRCLRAAYDTPCVQEDGSAADALLKRAAWYAVLAPATSSDAATLLAATAAEPRLDGLPAYKKLVATFRGGELVAWTAFEAEYRGELDALPDVFGGGGDATAVDSGAGRRAVLQTRVTQHNILAASKFYTRVSMTRLASLLAIDPYAAERAVADMVSDGALAAKIDRPAGIIRFGAPRSPDDVLNEWAAGISRLLTTVDRASGAIAKEAAVHKVELEGV